MFVLTVLYYQLPKAMGMAGGIQCGQCLGAGDVHHARQACWRGIVSPVLLSIGVALLVIYADGAASYAAELIVTASVNNRTRAVVDFVVVSSVPMALSLIGFSMMMPSIFILNGCGRNKEGTLITFVACWCVGIPAACVLAFQWELGLYGIWCGNAIGLGCGGAMGVLRLSRMDWNEEVVLVRKRLLLAS